ncbi:hypothetical protein HPB47_002304, partial [Ixodes persulcatus]
MDDFEDEAGWKTQTSKKRRHGSNSSEDTFITQPGYNLTVIVKPTDPTTIITNMNPLVLKQKLDSVAPDGVIQIRPNYRLNLLAIDARNVESTKALLQLKNLGTVQVQTYEPPPPSASVGIIRGVSADIEDADLLAVMREKSSVIQAKLLQTPQQLPQYSLDQALSLLVLQLLPPKKALQEVWPGQPESTRGLGDKKTTPRGRLLEDVPSALGLHCLNDGVATFVRPGVEGSVLDLSFATSPVRALWSAEPDSWGSDHLPIKITSLEGGPTTHKTCKAQHRALKTPKQEDIQRYRKMDRAFRKHTERLQRRQWRQRCESLHSPGGGKQAWRMARVLAGHAVSRSPVLGFVIAQNITVAQAVEFLADEFTSVPVSPQAYTEHSTITNTSPTTPAASDVDFTLKELQHALRHTARKRTAPGPDGITFQALRNLDATALPGLLEYLNDIWRLA